MAKPIPVMPASPKMSFEEFLEWADEDTHAEWVDGRVEFLHLAIDPETQELTVSVSKIHSHLVIFLMTLLHMYTELTGAGRVYGEPYKMRAKEGFPGREPDVFFIAKERLGQAKDQFFDGPPDLVIEVVSEESAVRDHAYKHAEYEAGGVREYWVVDPIQQKTFFYQLGEDGKYQKIGPGTDGVYHSAVLPGVWIKPEWFWQETLPTVLSILKSWNLL